MAWKNLSSWLSTPFHKYGNVCGWGLRDEVAKRGGGDAGTSTTTRDKEIARNPSPPEGLGRDGAHFFVAPSRRCPCIASSSRLDPGFVALPTNVTLFMKVSTKTLLPMRRLWISPFILMVGCFQPQQVAQPEIPEKGIAQIDQLLQDAVDRKDIPCGHCRQPESHPLPPKLWEDGRHE